VFHTTTRECSGLADMRTRTPAGPGCEKGPAVQRQRVVALPPAFCSDSKRPFRLQPSSPEKTSRIDAAQGSLLSRELQFHLRERGDLRRQIETQAARQQQLRRSLHESCCQSRLLSSNGDGGLHEAPPAAPVTFARAMDLLKYTFLGVKGDALERRAVSINQKAIAECVSAAEELYKDSRRNTCQKMFCLVQIKKFLRGLDYEAERIAGVYQDRQPDRRPSWAEAAVLGVTEMEQSRRVWCFRCGEGPYLGERACGNCGTILHYGEPDNTDNLMYLDFMMHCARCDLALAIRRTQLLEKAENLASSAAASVLHQPMAVQQPIAMGRPARSSLVPVSGRPRDTDGPAPPLTFPKGSMAETMPPIARSLSGKSMIRGRLGSLDLRDGSGDEYTRGPNVVNAVAPMCAPVVGTLRGSRRSNRGRGGAPRSESATASFVQSLSKSRTA